MLVGIFQTPIQTIWRKRKDITYLEVKVITGQRTSFPASLVPSVVIVCGVDAGLLYSTAKTSESF